MVRLLRGDRLTRLVPVSLVIPMLLAVGCGAQGGAFLSDGVYQGTDANGNEYNLRVAGNDIKLNGADTEVDDTARETTFTAKFMTGHPVWSCHNVDSDTAATCVLKAGSRKVSLDLMKEDD